MNVGFNYVDNNGTWNKFVMSLHTGGVVAFLGQAGNPGTA